VRRDVGAHHVQHGERGPVGDAARSGQRPASGASEAGFGAAEEAQRAVGVFDQKQRICR
jgi:hypothetical protein